MATAIGVAAADVAISPAPVFAPVLVVALVLIAFGLFELSSDQAAAEGAQTRAGVLIGAACTAGGAAAVLQFADGSRLDWLWSGLAVAAMVSGGLTAAGTREKARTPPAGPIEIPPGDVPDGVQRETVEVVLENVRELLVQEDTRAQSLHTRGTGIAGFAGIIVSLLAAIAQDLPAATRGGSERDVVVVFFVIGLILLVAAVLTVLFGVLRTRTITTIGIREVDAYLRKDYVSKSATWVRGRTMATLNKALVTERLQNNRRSAWLNRGGLLLASAIVAVAVAGLTLVL